jgi:NAD(P)-dependent dehydrogenase (short-subunit alcohol dehydrogenase family)
MSSKEFQDKVFIITGSSSGIGRATAKLAHDRGARVVIVSRREKELRDLALTMRPADVEIAPADLTREADCKHVIQAAIDRFSGIDVLVNAAGIIGNGSIENTTLAQWDTMMNINLRSVFMLSQLALAQLIQRKGNIVNVSSVTGVRAFPNVLAYCVSKAGVDQFTHCAALELAAKGVRVNAVDPGVVITNLHKSAGMPEDVYAKFIEHSKSTHPLGRAGTAEEVAESILFLASERASWITGVSMSVDGGRAQTCLR